MVQGAVPGAEGGYVLVKDAVKRAAPKEAPKPAALKGNSGGKAKPKRRLRKTRRRRRNSDHEISRSPIIDSMQVGELDLADDVFKDIFGRPVRRDILARMVNWQLAKRRSGNHKTKGIKDIAGTTKKPYKQKGTGRARQGSLRSPQFRGGATIFGPVAPQPCHGPATRRSASWR